MTISRRLMMLAVMTATVFAFAAPVAFAAPLVNPWASADVTLHPDGEAGGPVMLVSAELKPDVKLPATVSLSVPKGATVLWVGEILGGDSSADIEESHTVEPGAAFDVIVFKLTKARRGQVEVDMPNAVTASGNARTATLAWTSNADIASFRGVIRLLAGAKVLQTSTEASPNVGPDGASYYVPATSSIKSGASYTFAITYEPAATTAAPGAATGSSTTLVIILVAFALVILAFMLAFSRRRVATDEEYEDHGEPEASADETVEDADTD